MVKFLHYVLITKTLVLVTYVELVSISIEDYQTVSLPSSNQVVPKFAHKVLHTKR